MSDNKHVHDENCNHDHDHDHEHDEEMEIITLTLDDDTELECGVLGIFEVEDKEYIALLPLGEAEEEGDEVLLYQYKELDDEEFELELIEDQEEFDLVSEAFYALYTDEDDFEDDEE